MSLLIKGGRVLDPSCDLDGAYDVLIRDGKVEAILPQDNDCTADTVVDASGCWVVPGLIDLHVHFREPGFEYKETIATGSRAAAAGGYTSVCPMPNTKPVIDSAAMVHWLKDKADNVSPVHIWPVGAVTRGQQGKEMADIAGMAAAGAVAISEDGKSVMDSGLYRKAMIEAKKAGLTVLAHCEDINLVEGGVMNAGARADALGLPGISNAVEDIIAVRDILLAKETGCRLHLCHCSTEDSVKMVAAARAEGLPVTGEVCPHHFVLTDEDIPGDDGNYKMNPPLRAASDRDALVRALGDGIMTAISTDHAPHGAEEKSKGFVKAPFGIVGLETVLPLSVTYLVRTGVLTPLELIRRMSTAPAAVIGIDRGSLMEGKAADVTVIDPDAYRKIDRNTFVSKGHNTPFDGMEVFGRVKMTIVDGRIVYEYAQPDGYDQNGESADGKEL